MKKIYDISVPIGTETPVIPGDPRFKSRAYRTFEHGDAYMVHKISLGNHAGTHVDAPAHFIPGGAAISDLSLEVMNGRVRVIEIHSGDKIDVPELQNLVLVDDFRVLFKTRNSMLWAGHKHFTRKYIYMTQKAAEYLVENGIKLIGFDYLSIDRYGDESYPVHKTLLSNSVVLLEGLNLSEVEEGEYDMACLPLPLKGLDAAPARVILTA